MASLRVTSSKGSEVDSRASRGNQKKTERDSPIGPPLPRAVAPDVARSGADLSARDPTESAVAYDQ